MRVVLAAFFLLANNLKASSQHNNSKLFGNPRAVAATELALEALYSWDFASAAKHREALKKILDQQHPANTFLDALAFYWENQPIALEDPGIHRLNGLLETCVKQCETRLEKTPDDPETMFFLLTAKAMIMRYYASSGQNMKAVGEAKTVYKLVKKGNRLKDTFPEFHFTSGLYNYFRIAYPEKYPIYKPFSLFFEGGDKETGLNQLKFAANHTVFSKPEALAYLSYIHTNYENDPVKARFFAKQLLERYPENQFYQTVYLQALVLGKQYNTALFTADQLIAHGKRPYYQMVGHCFKAMALHGLHGNTAKAMPDYRKALELTDGLGMLANQFKTYIYAGFYRHHQEKGNKPEAKHYFKLAKEHDSGNYLKETE